LLSSAANWQKHEAFAVASIVPSASRMGKVAQTYDELDCWQLSAELRDRILTLSESWKSQDLKFYDQIRDAACSAPRNLSEGFGYYKPRVFAKHARIARASLLEVQNHLDDARRRRLLTEDQARSVHALTRRALGATTGLIRYLDSCKGEPPTDWDQNPPSTKRPGAPRNSDHPPENEPGRERRTLNSEPEP
jgi:four helix bundle protein